MDIAKAPLQPSNNLLTAHPTIRSTKGRLLPPRFFSVFPLLLLPPPPLPPLPLSFYSPGFHPPCHPSTPSSLSICFFFLPHRFLLDTSINSVNNLFLFSMQSRHKIVIPRILSCLG